MGGNPVPPQEPPRWFPLQQRRQSRHFCSSSDNNRASRAPLLRPRIGDAFEAFEEPDLRYRSLLVAFRLAERLQRGVLLWHVPADHRRKQREQHSQNSSWVEVENAFEVRTLTGRRERIRDREAEAARSSRR